MTHFTSRLSRLLPLVLLPAVLFAVLAVSHAARAYTCDSIMGSVDCGQGSGRKDIHIDRRAREDPLPSGHSAHHTNHRREYPWCTVGTGGHHRHCGYTSLEQCMQTVRGVGGICNRNPGYHGHH